MNDLLLSIINILLTMGVPPIDEHLQSIINAIGQYDVGSLRSFQNFARVLGGAFALIMASYEGYMMILGRRGIDVMRLLRITGFAFCISATQFIVFMVSLPGDSLANGAHAQLVVKNAAVEALLAENSRLQAQYADSLRAKLDTLTKRQIEQLVADQHHGDDQGTIDEMVVAIKQTFIAAQGEIKKMLITAETWFAEQINEIIRFIGEVIFEVSYFGLILASEFMRKILIAFCPIAFALSIIPPWASAWSQWISKFVSITLWPFLCYSCVLFVDFILLYELGTDNRAYTLLVGNDPSFAGTWGDIAQLGMQNIGATCRYVIALLIGVVCLKFVPEIASWLIPGGASSSIGSAMGGMASSMTMIAGSSALSVAKSGGNIAVSNASKVGGAAVSVVNKTTGAAGGAVGGFVSGFGAGANAGANMAGGTNTAGKLMAMSVLGAAGAVGGSIEGGVKGGYNGAGSMVVNAAKNVRTKVSNITNKTSSPVQNRLGGGKH